MIKFIIFDWDGTLVNSIEHIVNCTRQAAKELGFEVPSVERVRSKIGLRADIAAQQDIPGLDNKEKLQLFLQRYRQLYFSYEKADSLYPHVREVLTQLKASGYTLGIATSKSRNGLEQHLKAFDLAQFFQVSVCAEESESKPNPTMIYMLLEETGFTQAQSLMVGDTIYDIQLAHNAQIPVVALDYGAHTAIQLADAQPETILSDLKALPLWLKNR